MKLFLSLCLFYSIFSLCNAAGFNIYYNNTVPGDVQTAISAAVANVQQFLVLSYNVNIAFQYLSLGNVLADSGTSYFCVHPLYSLVLIPPALFVQFNGTNCFGAPTNIHLNVRINSDSSANWYTGVDGSGISSSQNDLVTYAMHEMMHGLGMRSGIVDSGGNNVYGNRSTLFDYFVFGTNNILSWPSFNGVVPSPAVTDTSFLTGSKLMFKGNASNSNFALYTPNPFVYGSSIQHRTGNNLMSHQIQKGQYWHVLSIYDVGLMNSFGYNTTNCSSPDLCGNCIHGNPCFSLFSEASTLESFFFYL